ncbi:MAG: hypothetical protein ACREQQ_17885 [Candidatus Binatia bacterium]
MRTSRAAVFARVALLAACFCGPAMAADLEIVSTGNFESGGKKYVEPCVHNNTAQVRQAHFKVGNKAVRWSFRPLPVPAGKTACFALDAPPIAPGLPNEVNVE